MAGTGTARDTGTDPNPWGGGHTGTDPEGTPSPCAPRSPEGSREEPERTPAAQAADPLPCQGDPISWCRDTATAKRCGWEQQCQHLWDSLVLGDVADGDGVADGDSVAEGKKMKCSLCTKVLKKMQDLAGDDPDESAVQAALQKGCRALGRRLGKQCQQLVSKYQEQISEGLQNGDMPKDICTAIGLCRS